MSYTVMTKHHALGNDFLVTFHPAVDDLAGFARWACDRRRGIGADGLLVGYDEPDRIPEMVLYNADGSLAEMSGNGIRCFAQALAERSGEFRDMVIKTAAGERLVRFTEVTGTKVVASVSMGTATAINPPDEWDAIGVDPLRPVAHLSMGNPHSIVACDRVDDVDLAAIGRLVPDVNLEIVEVGPTPETITMRVHERGAGITEACGTGACAAASAARQWGVVAGPEIVVQMDGGAVTVVLPPDDDGEITLFGPAELVGTVTVTVPEVFGSALER